MENFGSRNADDVSETLLPRLRERVAHANIMCNSKGRKRKKTGERQEIMQHDCASDVITTEWRELELQKSRIVQLRILRESEKRSL